VLIEHTYTHVSVFSEVVFAVFAVFVVAVA
jgi:hypothetical protein